MFTVFSVVQVFICVVLILLVLLHAGKDAGMSGAFGVGVVLEVHRLHPELDGPHEPGSLASCANGCVSSPPRARSGSSRPTPRPW